MEAVIDYAIKRITELENLLLPDVPDTVWPAEVEVIYSQLSVDLLPVHHQRRLKHHINRMLLDKMPPPSVVTAAKSLCEAMEKYA